MAAVLYPTVDRKLFHLKAMGQTIDIGNSRDMLASSAIDLQKRLGKHNVQLIAISDSRDMQRVSQMAGS